MKMIGCSLIRRLLSDKSGQSMVWVGVSLTALLGMSGLTLDVGHAYVVRSQVQSVVNACALAGVSGLPSSTTAQSNVSTCETNSNKPSWGTVTVPSPVATVKCVTAVMPSGQSCTGSNILNAVQVSETVKVPTYFMRIFGYSTLPVSATATATPAEARPWIVEFVLDTTPSMASSDSNCTGASTAEECALNGIQGMIAKLNPCPPGTKNCGPSNANIRFGLMSFPNLSTSDAQYNYNSDAGAGSSCASGTVYFQLYSSPAIPASTATEPYTYITYGTGSSAVNTTYMSTYGATDMDANGFYTNWYSATDNSGLNPSSTLVQAIGRNADSVKPCLQEPNTSKTSGTSGITSFAGALYAAQTNLQAELAAYPKVNNLAPKTMIIFLSDGQANALADYYFPAGTAVTSPTVNGVQSADGANSGGKSIMNTNGLYPSGVDACQQAIMASQYATNWGTRVYTIAYGTETGGCLYNSNGSGTVNSTILAGKTNGSGSGSDVAITSGNPLILTAGSTDPAISAMTDVTPCNTIMNMASSLSYFYSDYMQEKAGGSGVNTIDLNCKNPDSDTAALTSLNDIFQAIYGSITSARLIPNNSI